MRIAVGDATKFVMLLVLGAICTVFSMACLPAIVADGCGCGITPLR